MGKEIEKMGPGIGQGGIVMCPLIKAPCLKSGCEFWVELTYGTGQDAKQVGRCAIAWDAIVGVETRQATDRLANIILAATAKPGKGV